MFPATMGRDVRGLVGAAGSMKNTSSRAIEFLYFSNQAYAKLAAANDSLATHLLDRVELSDAVAIPLDSIARDQPVIALDRCCRVGESIGRQLGSELEGVEYDIVWNCTRDRWLEMSGVDGQGDAGLESPGLLRRKFENWASMRRSSDSFTSPMKRGLSSPSRPPYHQGRALGWLISGCAFI